MGNYGQSIKIIIFLFLFLLFIMVRGKYLEKELINNKIYAVGEVLKIYYGKGRSVGFKYSINGQIFYTSSMNFTKNINYVGSKYFVVVNRKNLEQAYILDCCPYDESKHFVPSEGLDKIPDAELQKKADEAFEEIFNSPLGRLLPPYSIFYLSKKK